MHSFRLQYYLTFLCCTVSTLTRITVNAQTTAPPLCESTGHRCIVLDQCSTMQDGQYQWCGGCENHVRCLGGVGTLFAYNFEPYTKWDDNRKNYELTSNTCTECYYPCSGPSAPTKPTVPVCDQTGLGCLMDACTLGANGNFQYCGNCSHYVTCSIQGGGYTLATCPLNTFYDDFQRTCLPVSTTCFECYTNCSAPTTQAPTTQAPTTQAPTSQAPTTQVPTTTPATTQPPDTPAQTSDNQNLGTTRELVEESTGDLSTDGVTATTGGGITTANGVAGFAKFVMYISTTFCILVAVAI